MKWFHHFTKALLLPFVLLGVNWYSQAQIPGQSYFPDGNDYVEYIYGDHPVILSIPHDGDLKPDEIPDRSCPNCVYGNDTDTQEMGRAMAQAYFNKTGHYPFVVINRLARIKFDANRNKNEDDNDNNPIIQEAFDNYHAFISDAKNKIIEDFGRGLFIDIHGHAHEIERVELGYTLTGHELRLADEILNTTTYMNRNSIKTLVYDKVGDMTHVELIRGGLSFGTLFHDKGFPTVPSAADPFPKVDEPYFNGGYNVWIHGSRLNSGNIDAIQIEINQDVRFDPESSALFVDAVATSLIEYLSLHYGFGVIDFDGDGVFSDQDCDDFNASINPNAEEIPYNGIDDDCDPTTPDDDLDGDDFNNAEDCDDNNANINPDAEEIPYNGIDDDCDPSTPDDDLDGDDFNNAEDCDDSNANINPGAEEIPYNGIDDDCDPTTPDDDLDGDDFNNAEDCDDNNANINPGAEEIPYNGIDDDCDPTTPDDDLDGDNFDTAEDCDDSNANINPGAEEIPYNGIDDDCDPTTPDDDLDGDDFDNAEDCDDNNANINPGAEEIPYNGIDDDCDPTTPDDDLDGDNFDNAEDCDDSNANINPDAIEVTYNGIDDDCDPTTLDDDLDGDGFNNVDDCDDNNANINPGAEEIPYNGIDDDCDPATLDDDLDQDGFNNANDCDDSNASINPDSEEVPYNGIDDDCNPTTLDDDLDGDGFNNVDDCDDNNANINPSATEIIGNQVDENCDGIIEVTSSVEPIEPEPMEIRGDEIFIYPNPAKDFIYIEKVDKYQFLVEIYDVNKRLVLRKFNTNQLNIQSLANGIYFLIYYDEMGERIVKKLIVDRK